MRIHHGRSMSALLVFVFICLAHLCFAQAVVDQIAGTIHDSSGAVISNAQIKALQTNTGFTRSSISEPDGSYVITNLPIGPYTIEVSAAGFKTYKQDGVVLQVNTNPTINAVLPVGAVSERVEVEADVEMAETQTTGISQVINEQSVVDLPLNGRQATQLILLSGAAVTANGLVGSKNYPSSVSIALAGGTGNGTNYLMDGGYHNDVFSAVNLPVPFPDVLQEFSVQTSSIPASYGERAGGVVNIVTKSGTNAYHGDMFEFLRNGAVNAKNYFASKVDAQKRNQFGGTFGGPILRDKLFFFGGWQQTILRTAPPTTTSFVPTAQQLLGNFGSSNITDPTTGKQFSNNQIPVSRFSTQALNFLKFIPVSSDPTGKLLYSIPNNSTENQYLGRIDWTQSTRDTIFGRYYYAGDNNPAPPIHNNLLLTANPGVIDTVQSLTIGDTFTLTPTTVNAFRFTWDFERVNRGPAAVIPSASDLGLAVAPSAGNSPQISVGSLFSTMCGTCSVAKVYSGSRQVADDINLIKGRQQFAFGGEWVRKYLNYQTASQQNAAFNFNGQITGNAISDLLLGLPSTFGQGNITALNFIQNYYGFYASDKIKLTSRLSLNAGLRWEPYFPAYDTKKRATHFDMATYLAGTKTKMFANAPAGLTFPGDSGFPQGGTHHRLANFAPRLGVVWDPRGDAKTIVRVGYGILYDVRTDLEVFDRFGFGAPWASVINLNNPAGGFGNPYLGYPGGDPFPLPIPPTSNATFTSAAQYVNLPLHIKTPYFQEWNVSVQQQLSANWLFSMNYIGNEGTHLWMNYQGDPAVFIPGQCGSSACSTVGNTNSRRKLTQLDAVNGAAYSSLVTINDGGNSSYNAMLVSLNRRLEKNVSLLLNYTWSHCLNEGETNAEMAGGNYQNPANLAADRGNCSTDTHHIFNAALVASTPHFTRNVAERLLSDWRLSLIISGHSGGWFTPVTGTDASLTGVGSDRPNVVGNANSANPTRSQWFNTAAYSKNLPGTYGNARRNSLLGPGGYQPDMAIFRNFPYKFFDKSQYFELRLEAFNVTNHPTFANPTSTFTSPNFGKILGANNPRIMQVALKYVF